MKRIHRTKVVEYPVYIADDGTEFTTKKDCVEYEKGINAFTLYDRECKETKTFDMAFYVLIKSTDAIATVRDLAQSQGEYADGIDEEGFFVWNEWEEQYIKLDYLQYNIDENIELMEKAKAGYKTIMGKEYENNG